MASYTFPAAVVLIEGTMQPAVGATGILRTDAGGTALPMYDLNDSSIPSVTVGELGVHPPFKADEPYGVLDFGSARLVAISREAMTAAIEVSTDLSVVADRVTLLEQNGGGGGGGGGSQILNASSLSLAPPVSVGDVLVVIPNTN